VARFIRDGMVIKAHPHEPDNYVAAFRGLSGKLSFDGDAVELVEAERRIYHPSNGTFTTWRTMVPAPPPVPTLAAPLEEYFPGEPIALEPGTPLETPDPVQPMDPVGDPAAADFPSGFENLEAAFERFHAEQESGEAAPPVAEPQQHAPLASAAPSLITPEELDLLMAVSSEPVPELPTAIDPEVDAGPVVAD